MMLAFRSGFANAVTAASLTIISAGVDARAATVEAGESSGASWVRIAVGGAPFLVERSGERQIDFVSPDGDLELDLSRLSANIAASRVASARLVSNDAGVRLRFVLECDCGFAAMVEDGVLEIEIRDPENKTEIATPPKPSAERNRSTNNANAPLRSPIPQPRGGRIAESQTASAATPSSDAGLSGGDSGSDTEDEVRLARRKLLEQLSLAADQGLLDFASKEARDLVPDAPKPIPAEEPEVAADSVAPAEAARDDADEAGPAVATPSPPQPRPVDPLEVPVRARTAFEKSFRTDRKDTIAQMAPCVEDWRLDASDWPGEANFADELSAYRLTLLAEFDAPNPVAVTGLARLYIAWGFGAEARQLLDLYGEAAEDAELLRDLALIVDGRAPTDGGPITAAGPCSGPVALWYYAAGLRGDPQLTPKNINDMLLTALETSPNSIRALLAPRIIGDRLDAGDLAVASKIDQKLGRMQLDSGPALDLARARLLAATGDLSSAEDLFRRLGARSLPESQEALLLLLDSRRSRGAEISEDLSLALSEAAFLARGGVMERKLKIAEIEASALVDGLPAALEKLDDALARRPIARAILQDAGHAVLEASLAEDEDPFRYARAILDYAPNISTEQAGDAARIHIAGQLTETGLPNAALKILEPALSRNSRAARLAAARIRLSLDEPEMALSVLSGLSGGEAMSLRADALEALERLPDARRAAERIEDEPASARAERAFRIGDWDAAAETGDRSQRLLAAFMAGNTDGPSSDEVAPAPILDGVDDDAVAAFLDPPALSFIDEDADVTLRDVATAREASERVRAIIEEALGDG
ncbi:MAG: hypothetical protein AAF360_00505 [Pseudomonadota bacterium]